MGHAESQGRGNARISDCASRCLHRRSRAIDPCGTRLSRWSHRAPRISTNSIRYCRSVSKGWGAAMKRVALILLLLCTPVLAHDANHPELNSWFDHLARAGKGCAVLSWMAVRSPIQTGDSKDGHYRVRLDNQWIDVPDDALITEPNRAGRTMVWTWYCDLACTPRVKRAPMEVRYVSSNGSTRQFAYQASPDGASRTN